MGRPPTCTSVKVQLKSFKSSHELVSIQVFRASEGMSLEAGHVGLGLLDEVEDDEWDAVVEDPEVLVEELKGAAEGLEVADEEELDDSSRSATLEASVDLDPTLMTCFATRPPTTAPTITAIPSTTAAIQSPETLC
jgi:hypothetical protein